MPDIYVMNGAMSMGIAIFLLGTAICVGAVTLIEKVVRWKRR